MSRKAKLVVSLCRRRRIAQLCRIAIRIPLKVNFMYVTLL